MDIICCMNSHAVPPVEKQCAVLNSGCCFKDWRRSKLYYHNIKVFVLSGVKNKSAILNWIEN